MTESSLSGAKSVAKFCERWSVGRTTVYAEIAAGRLKAIKVGSKTLITDEEGARWAGSLPELKSMKQRE